MPQTRMFRDRVVSMEQTLEGGEKNLELLKALCRDAFPEFEYRAHVLDHERDVFVMTLEAPDGRRKTVSWTRMVLFDAERIPVLTGDPVSPLRTRLVEYLKARAARSEILVTFRHLEDGWVDTPEPRREKRRGRRGGKPQGRRDAPEPRPARGAPPAPPDRRPPRPTRPQPPQQQRQPQPSAPRPGGEAQAPPGKRRRRFRRRRRGRGPGGGPGGPGGTPGGAGPGPGGPPAGP